MKIKRPSHRHYYEKIVKWKTNKEYEPLSMIMSYILLGIASGISIALIAISNDVSDKLVPIMGLFAIFSVAFGVWSFFLNHTREVKWRRIND